MVDTLCVAWSHRLWQIKQQAADLVRRAKERRVQEEKELQKTQERERVRYGKELLMAKKKEEEEVQSMVERCWTENVVSDIL